MSFEVTVLGSASAMPTSKRNPAAQLVHLLGRFFLIDCGEGTQTQLRKIRFKIQKLNYICISHLHGDHYLGLIGLLSTLSLLNREKELVIFAPEGLSKILDLHFSLSYSKLSFPLSIISLKGRGLKKIFEDDKLELYSFGLKHRIPCWGFKLMEKKPPKKICKDMLDIYNIPFHSIPAIKLGDDFIKPDGKIIANNILTVNGHRPRSYAYCSDTKYFNLLSDYVKNVDFLYHESTFHSNLSEKAVKTYHSTSQDAARVALNANVKKLVLGHFSSRYKDLNILKEDAEKIFKNVELAVEGSTFKIKKIFR